MDKSSALESLKDIHLPQPIGFWPIAYGWYICILLLILTLFSIGYLSYRWYLSHQPKREALALLERYKEDYKKTGNSPLSSAKIAELLKRVALFYYPRKNVAGLHGEEWIDFLNKTGKNINFDQEAPLLLELPFKPSDNTNLLPLFSKVELWIKQRRSRV